VDDARLALAPVFRLTEMSMQEFLDEISRHHFPKPPASPREIEEFERRVGWRLDPDLRAFYLHCNGADLFKHPDTPFSFLPVTVQQGR
jgi:hypothetical protein